MHCSLSSLGCAFGFAPPAEYTSLTAIHALRIAQRRLRPEVRAKLLSVSSARTDQTLVPDAWRFVFLDPATSGKCRVVTVAAKTSSEHPDTIEAFGSAQTENISASLVIPQNKLLIDSSKALEEVRLASKLKGVRSAEYRLTQQKGKTEPSWYLQFFAENSEPLAKFRIGARTGGLEQGSNGK